MEALLRAGAIAPDGGIGGKLNARRAWAGFSGSFPLVNNLPRLYRRSEQLLFTRDDRAIWIYGRCEERDEEEGRTRPYDLPRLTLDSCRVEHLVGSN